MQQKPWNRKPKFRVSIASLTEQETGMSANMIKIALAAMVLATALPLTACDDKDSGSQIGEKIDEGVNDTKRAIEDATD